MESQMVLVVLMFLEEVLDAMKGEENQDDNYFFFFFTIANY